MHETQPFSLFTEQDVYLFREGKHFRLYEKFGSHFVQNQNKEGIYFSVWAPNAVEVSVIGEFNGWHSEANILFPRWDMSGIWEGFVPNLEKNLLYKYGIRTANGELLEKSDPYALSFEQNRQAASLTADDHYEWLDNTWMQTRKAKNNLQAPLSVYEVHLGSWMRAENDPALFLNYKGIAEKLIPYILNMGFTHVEFMPVMEHPYEPSWGYQITGFFAANSRFGTPQDLKYLIDQLHLNNIGVILDWVPSHFPGDANGLHFFDGSFLYEHEDPRKGYHPQWNSHIFNYGRPEVKSFLISNAMFWLDRYHADGLRVDAVTSILYLDYARDEGAWEPNIFGGNVNLEAEIFLKDFNVAVHSFFPEVLTIAEESSDFPNLTKSIENGGIGFTMKWMMGWMHDTLKYFSQDPVNRKFAHHKITFASVYMFNEKYMMPLSHDEVVHGKASMIYKMPGDEWQQFANLRALYIYMFTHPGAKLLFMGNEFGQTNEWNFAETLKWELLQHPVHKGLQRIIKDLNQLYRNEPALYENQFDQNGFEWVEADDEDRSTFVYLRKGIAAEDVLMIILNFTPVVRDYSIGVSESTSWEIILNSDEKQYAGSGVKAEVLSELKKPHHNRENSIIIKIPPLAGVVLKMKKAELVKKSATANKKVTAKKGTTTTPKSKSTPPKKTGTTVIAKNILAESSQIKKKQTLNLKEKKADQMKLTLKQDDLETSTDPEKSTAANINILKTKKEL